MLSFRRHRLHGLLLVFLTAGCNDTDVLLRSGFPFDSYYLPDPVASPEIPAIEYVPVADGSFLLGHNSLGSDDNKPAQLIDLSAYEISRYPVTNEQWFAFYQAQDSINRFLYVPRGYFDVNDWINVVDGFGRLYPISGISWNAAVEFCQWVGARLPTEAEWEKAARSTDNRSYPWGNTPPFDNGSVRANLNGWIYGGGPSPVNFFENNGNHTLSGASPYGVVDMIGNVWEWTNDWYQADYYINIRSTNPHGPPEFLSNGRKSIRGGSYNEDPDEVTAFTRFARNPDRGYFNVGFRIVNAQ